MDRPRSTRLAFAAAAVWLGALSALVTACSPSDSTDTSATSNSSSGSGSASAPASADACAKTSLKTVKSGTLTMATDKPVFEPWFVDDKPESGQGFEGAVAKAVATKLGFADTEVTWTRVTFDNAIKPGAKDWDLDINEFSITAERKQAVDFSSPYYDVTQAVITTKRSKAAGATSLADLKSVKIGAQVGTTSFDAIQATIKPTGKPAVYNNNDDAKKALDNGQIDALVVDLPTAFFITGAELKDGKIIGQLPGAGGTPEQFGLVLDKGSPLTACVSKAVDALKADGTLDRLVKQWLSQAGGAPVLS